jgi:exosortase F-associated protein
MASQIPPAPPPHTRVKRIVLILLALSTLLCTYLLQRFNFLSFIESLFRNDLSFHSYTYFIFNKTLRMCINDGACVILIYALFRERKYIRVAFYVFLFELLVILPIYFVLKLTIEGTSELSSPLLSQIHRMVVNPTLMLLLMVAFFYQRSKSKNATA